MNLHPMLCGRIDDASYHGMVFACGVLAVVRILLVQCDQEKIYKARISTL
jgi:hypothetical protein